MLSDTPPERDIEWTSAGVEGAYRFLQRVWRLVNEAAEKGARESTPRVFGGEALELRRAAHRSVAAATAAIDKLRFNVAIAHIYELANALSAALNAAGQHPDPDMQWISTGADVARATSARNAHFLAVLSTRCMAT